MRISKNQIRMGGDQNLGRRNVEQLIFRNLKIANIEMPEDELFEILDFNSSFLRNHLNTKNI